MLEPRIPRPRQALQRLLRVPFFQNGIHHHCLFAVNDSLPLTLPFLSPTPSVLCLGARTVTSKTWHNSGACVLLSRLCACIDSGLSISNSVSDSRTYSIFKFSPHLDTPLVAISHSVPDVKECFFSDTGHVVTVTPLWTACSNLWLVSTTTTLAQIAREAIHESITAHLISTPVWNVDFVRRRKDMADG